MNCLGPVLLFLAILHYSYCGPLRLQKRAAFYIANETACVVDNTVYSNGDPIPTDDPCEACKCRPPGFACVLKECEVKPGCRAVRRTGHCCPDYICGCEHNGRMYRDGDEIRDSQNPCYTCHCQGSSIACAFIDCFFRVDCAPEYVAGECCPHYTNCTEPKNPFEGSNPYLRDKESSVDTTLVPSTVIVPGVSYVEDTTEAPNIETTVIEIFEIETKEPELLKLNPEEVGIDVNVNEDSSESEENIPDKASPDLSDTSDIVERPVEETASDENVELKNVEVISDTTVAESETVPPRTDSDEETGVELSTEANSQPEVPLAVENIDVEPEEPSNNLEAENSVSDYGKSLRLDDTNEQGNETVPKDQKSETEQVSTTKQENQTQQPEKLPYIKESSSETLTTPKIQEETNPPFVKVSTTDENLETSNSGSNEKISLYVEKDSLQTESNETETTVVEIKDTTVPIADKSDISFTPTIIATLFKSDSNKLEDQKSTMLPDLTIIKSDKTDSPVKNEDLELHLSSHSETERSSTKAETVSPTMIPQADKTTKID